MEELSTEELDRLLKGEYRYVEYKKFQDIDDGDEVLRQLTAFANRAGGTVLYGVLNDRTIEGASINADSKVENISNLVRDRTSPIAEFLPLFHQGSNGDVLALRVLRHKGMPCAVVRRKYHEIESRRYFIRTNTGVRMMDDRTLEWLFLHQEDPAINESFRFCVQYARDEVSLAAWIPPVVVMPLSLIYVFQALREEQRELLRSEEPRNMRSFLAEIMPYAILAQLSWIYGRSWKVRSRRVGELTTWSSIPADSEQLDLDRFTTPDTSTMLQSLEFDVSGIFPWNRTLCLPPETALNVNVEGQAPVTPSSVITISKSGTFDISLSVRPALWTVGAAPGQPLGSAFGGVHRLQEQSELQSRFAYVSLDMDFTASFEFPDEPCDEILEYLAWAQQLLTEIRAQWDWDQLVGTLPPGILYSIDRDVREILSYMRQNGEIVTDNE